MAPKHLVLLRSRISFTKNALAKYGQKKLSSWWTHSANWRMKKKQWQKNRKLLSKQYPVLQAWPASRTHCPLASIGGLETGVNAPCLKFWLPTTWPPDQNPGPEPGILCNTQQKPAFYFQKKILSQNLFPFLRQQNPLPLLLSLV